MTASSLPLTIYLTNKCSKSTKNRLIEVQFGNGYKQVAKDGLNSNVENWQMQYMPLTGTNLTTLRTFLNTVGCDVWFTWTPFGDTITKKWRVDKDSLKEEMLNISLIAISFSITQVFDLGT